MAKSTDRYRGENKPVVLLIWLVDSFFELYRWMVLARVILSWVRVDPYHPVIRFLYKATEPVLKPFRRVIPALGGIDFSPIVVFFLLDLARQIMIRFLFAL